MKAARTTEAPNAEDYYMTRAEVEDHLGVSTPYVYNLRDSGKILGLKGGMYDAESVKKYKKGLPINHDVLRARIVIKDALKEDYRKEWVDACEPVRWSKALRTLAAIGASHEGESGYQKRERFLHQRLSAINDDWACHASHDEIGAILAPIEDMYHRNIVEAIENALATFGDKRTVAAACALDRGFAAYIDARA
jgi:hypothetical protein